MQRLQFSMAIVNAPPWLPSAPPVGIASIIASIRAAGWHPHLFDLNTTLFHRHPDLRDLWSMERHTLWLDRGFTESVLPLLEGDLREAVDRIAEMNPTVCGFSVAAPRQRIVAWMCRRLRESGYRGAVVLGGPATFVAEERKVLLNEVGIFADFVVVGEGEETLGGLLEALASRREPKNVPSLAVREGKDWVETERSPRCLDLARLPVPDFTLFDLTKYSDPVLSTEWSRGCVRRCRFCEVGSMWGRWRAKPPKRIVLEMNWLKRRFGVATFALVDSAVNGNSRHFNEVLDLLIQTPELFSWTSNMIAVPSFSSATAKKMAAAGCVRAEVGVESGSQTVLNAMRKGITVENNERTLHALKEAGIEAVVFLVVGFPGEGEREFEETLGFLTRNRDTISLVRSANALALQEGAEVTEEVELKGWVPDRSNSLWQHEWRFPGENTLEVRRGRVQRILSHLDSLGIPHELAGGVDEYVGSPYDGRRETSGRSD